MDTARPRAQDLVPPQTAPGRDLRGPADGDLAWRRRLDEVLAEPGRLRLVFQPIVALQDAVIVG